MLKMPHAREQAAGAASKMGDTMRTVEASSGIQNSQLVHASRPPSAG
jgi:hypothetical protein